MYALAICILLPLLEAASSRRLRADSNSATRLASYRKDIAMLWLLAAAAAWLSTPASLLLAPGSVEGMSWLTGSAMARWLVLGSALLLAAVMAAQAMYCLFNAEFRLQCEAAAQSLKFMLPIGTRERRWWILLAVSAGVCEELVYRGFLLTCFGELGLAWAWLLSSAAFGLAHAYQGRAAVLRSAIVGGILGLVAIANGHLALAIVLHIVLDLLPLAYYRPDGKSVEGVAEVGDQVVGILDAD